MKGLMRSMKYWFLNIEKVVVNSSVDICAELDLKWKMRLVELKALQTLNVGHSRVRRIQQEVESLFKRNIMHNFRNVFESAIMGWVNDVVQEGSEDFKSFVRPVFNGVHREMKSLWRRCDDETVRLYEIKELPMSMEEIKIQGVLDNSVSNNVGGISCAINSFTGSLIMTAVKTIGGVLITAILGYVGVYVALNIAGLFSGGFWLEIIISVLTSLGFIALGGARVAKTTFDDLNRAEKQIYNVLFNKTKELLRDKKDPIKEELKVLPRTIVENCKKYYENEFSVIENKLNNEIEERRRAKMDSLEGHRSIIESAKELRETKISPMLVRVKTFIEGCFPDGLQ